jgi:hypothetical protein
MNQFELFTEGKEDGTTENIPVIVAHPGIKRIVILQTVYQH